MAILMRLRPALMLLFGLTVATLLAACGGPDVPLGGTIIDAYTGKPVSAAIIELGSEQLTTDDGGKYQAMQWNQKDTLHIMASGYEPISIVWAEQPQLAEPTLPLATVNAKLRPNTVSGTITDAYTGKPLAGALVKASDTLSATTTPDGYYALVGVPEMFRLAVSAQDYAPASQTLKQQIVSDLALRPSIASRACLATPRSRLAPMATPC